MSSAQFTINGFTTSQVVSASSTVTFNLVDTTGVRTCVYEIFGTHDQDGTYGYITPSVVYLNATGSNAQIVLPAGLGQTLGIRCTINGGKDLSGRNDPTAASRGSVCVFTSAGLRLGFRNETDEWGGWLKLLNNVILSIS